jgi:hypothetical protein
MYITIGVIGILLLLVIVSLVFGSVLSEFPSFMYMLLGAIVLLISAAIYLSFAVPSYADSSIFGGGKEKSAPVTQDEMVGLELIEEN